MMRRWEDGAKGEEVGGWGKGRRGVRMGALLVRSLADGDPALPWRVYFPFALVSLSHAPSQVCL